MANVKTGITMRPEIEFTPAEWAEVFPHETVEGAIIDKAGNRHEFDIDVDEGARRFILSIQTGGFALGPAEFDVAVTRGGVTTPVPYTKNLQVTIIPGVTTRGVAP